MRINFHQQSRKNNQLYDGYRACFIINFRASPFTIATAKGHLQQEQQAIVQSTSKTLAKQQLTVDDDMNNEL